MGFQSVVNANLPLAIEGDFCSGNPRGSLLAGEGALVSGALPVIVGRFGWVDPNGKVSNSAIAWQRVGFIGLRGQLVLITPWLGQFGFAVQPGFEMTLHDSGDFFMRLAAGGTVGQKIFASYGDGTAIAGAAGSTPAGSAFTASIATTTMTVTAIGSGTLVPGQPVAGAAAGTVIVSQLTGATGGVGTYSVSPSQTFASGALTTASAYETKWYVDSLAAAGELAMTSTRG